MACIATVTVSLTNGSRLLYVPRTLAKTAGCSFLLTQRTSALGYYSLQQRCSIPARKLVIRAARTESKGVSLGLRAPHFELQEPLTGKMWKLEDFESYPALLVMFICNHCPFVEHLKKDIVKLSNYYMKLERACSGSNIFKFYDYSPTEDGPEFMVEEAKLFSYPIPYLYDESQDVARVFGAVCTPEFLLVEKDGRRPFELVYHGQFDDS